MPSPRPAAPKKGGVKSQVTSPSPSYHPPPPLPRLKLKIRQPSPAASSSSKPQSKSAPRASNFFDTDSSSDLTPPEDDDDDDDEDFDESMVTPRKGVHKGRNSPAQTAQPTFQAKKSTEKKKSSLGKDAKGKAQAVGRKPSPAPPPSPAAVNGREKKRAHKLEEVERRRARDAKFDIDDDTEDDDMFSEPSPILAPTYPAYVEDAVSSFGDDESDRDNLTEDELTGIPEALMGHEIEDLNYGAGHDAEVEKQQSTQYWDEATSDDEEEEVFINQLSGSEIDAQSQSSVDGLSDDSMSDSDFASSSDDGLDEFGFPIPSASLFPINEETTENADPGLVLMENWDGQFVLVQPRHERSRSRHRGDKGSRTAGSVSGSTNVSGNDQQGLIIDPDADLGEFDSDQDSYWSGVSDEDDGGDTTDSMAEEDMPMLDSPALNELMEAQMAEAVLRMAVENGEMPLLDHEIPPLDPGLSVVVTDATGLDVHTPALSTTSSAGPIPGPTTATLPQTPAPAAPTGPVMGTFHPTTDDPAQHAVIDGSGADTKSPFTHRRRSRRGRDAASVASSKRSQEDRKRKQSAQDPFSPASTHAVFGLSKKARYSSIPGHPRYVAARRAAEALCDPQDRETTPSDSDELSLEDMLETSVLMHELEDQGHHEPVSAEHLRHMIRFDRVGVSTYLRRNFGATASGEIPGQAAHLASPNGNSLDSGRGGNLAIGGQLEDTLVGPIGGRMLVSPVLGPTHGRGSEAAERKREKRRRRKAADAAAAAAAAAASAAGSSAVPSATIDNDVESQSQLGGVALPVIDANLPMPILQI
ncbi:hypothetical protein I317_05216 [Kwoniella heveanensis CBS 569]|nr:hypothetical protein I317_05216 [Kwoniella heveanensis CBS 569]